MAREYLWKRVVRREMAQARRETCPMNFTQACALSDFMIDSLRKTSPARKNSRNGKSTGAYLCTTSSARDWNSGWPDRGEGDGRRMSNGNVQAALKAGVALLEELGVRQELDYLGSESERS
jgi:hypothetical protein